jgi:hypothetical protein
MEEWKQIGQSNYEVSTLGNLRNSKTGGVLKPKTFKKKKDYVCYGVTIADTTGGKQKHHKMHLLVARAFIPNPENRTEIDHIDRNTANNAVSNLRWATRSEQAHNSRTRADNKLGEKNIHFRPDGRIKPYFVSGVKFEGSHFFATLEEAVAYRNNVAV